MDEKTKREIEKIIGGIKCPKNFTCYRVGFETMCKAMDIGLEAYVECLEEAPDNCSFAFTFGTAYFCKCPLRVYICKKLKK